MSTKLKTMSKKQVSWSTENLDLDTEVAVKMNIETDDAITLRKNPRRPRRHRTSLGLEELLKCPVCNQQLKSPKMLPCQHTFCKKCLELKLEEKATQDKDTSDKTLRCPVCRSPASEPSSLPGNLSLENLLRVVKDEVSPLSKRPTSLYANFDQVKKEKKRSKSFRVQAIDPKICCIQCKSDGQSLKKCGHCDKVLCKTCQPLHAKQLKQSFKPLIEQLQDTMSKLDRRIESFQEKTDKKKNSIEKEIEAKISELMKDKDKRLKMADALRANAESSAEKIKREIRESQVELAKLSNDDFDDIDDVKKMAELTKLDKKSSDLISRALSLQLKAESSKSQIIEPPSPSTPKALHAMKRTGRSKLVSSKDLQRPSGIALNPQNNEIYVTCPGNSQVVVFDRHYKIVRRIKDPQMIAPKGIVYVEVRREIYVTDNWKHCIFVFNGKGQRVRVILEKDRLRSPEGLAVLESQSWLYIADTGNDRILAVDFDGTPKGGIGPVKTPDDSVSQVHNFNQPTDVAVSERAIVVADCGNHKVKVFNGRGHLVFSIGGFGTFKGLLKSPEVVKLASNGNIIVGDSENGRVQVFSPEGDFLCVYESQRDVPRQPGWVSGVASLASGDVLVADSKNNTLELF